MTQDEYDAVSGWLMDLAKSIEDAKRPGYTIGDDDCLANFKRVAERVGVTPGQAWAVYFLKHVDAVVSMMTRPDLPRAEAAPGRFADLINYARLGFALLEETEKRPASQGSDEQVVPVHVGQLGWVVPETEKIGA